MGNLTDYFSQRYTVEQGGNGVVELRDRKTGEPVEARDGVFRFVASEDYSSNFGLQWNAFRSTQIDSHSGLRLSFTRFWEGTRWKPRELYGKTVLEAGSGAGRFTEVLLDAGARVCTFDLSNAVDANYANNHEKGEAVFFQASIFDIPCDDDAFDYVFCYGVLQHTPDPDRAFAELARKLKPGTGRISIDFYIKTSRLDPFNQPKYFWRRWTRDMEPEKLLRIIRAYMPFWLPIDTMIRRIPWLGPKLLALLHIPCWNYLRSGLNRQQRLEWAILDTFDALSAAYDDPRTLEEVKEMVEAIPYLTDIDVRHGGNGVIANARRI